MGQLLSSPITDRSVDVGTVAMSANHRKRLDYATVTMQGWRRFMEDAHQVKLSFSSHEMQYFAVFDGHSGGEVSKYCAAHLGDCIEEKLNKFSCLDQQIISDILVKSFMEIDDTMLSPRGLEQLKKYAQIENKHPELDSKAEALGRFLMERAQRKRKKSIEVEADFIPQKPKLRRDRSLTLDGDAVLEMGRCRVLQMCQAEETQPKEEKSSGGTTALVTLIHDNTIYVANAGDCRAVLSRNGVAIDLSIDHKPDVEAERVRIEKAGGFVTGGRVNGCLNLSRALGDFDFKANPNIEPYLQAITAYPDILIETLDRNQDQFVILACDGIWECLTSQAVVDFVRSRLTSDPPARIVQDLFSLCMAKTRDGHRGSGLGLDNMTAILVVL